MSLDPLSKMAAIMELALLNDGIADNVLSQEDKVKRIEELQTQLWPRGIKAEHQANPMNHMGRNRPKIIFKDFRQQLFIEGVPREHLERAGPPPGGHAWNYETNSWIKFVTIS